MSARDAVAEDSYVLRFQLTNGTQGVMQQTAGAWGPLAGMTRIAGTQGTVWIEDGNVKIADRSGTRELPVPADLVLPVPPAPSDDPRKRYSVIELGPYTRLCEVLRDRMEGRDGSSAVPVPTFEDGLASMEVIDAIRRSATNNGALVSVR